MQCLAVRGETHVLGIRAEFLRVGAVLEVAVIVAEVVVQVLLGVVPAAAVGVPAGELGEEVPAVRAVLEADVLGVGGETAHGWLCWRGNRESSCGFEDSFVLEKDAGVSGQDRICGQEAAGLGC